MSRFLSNIAQRGAGLLPVMAPRTPSVFESRRHEGPETGELPQSGDAAPDAADAASDAMPGAIPAIGNARMRETKPELSSLSERATEHSSLPDAPASSSSPDKVLRAADSSLRGSSERPSADLSPSAGDARAVGESASTANKIEPKARPAKIEVSRVAEAAPPAARPSVSDRPKPDPQRAAPTVEPKIASLPQPARPRSPLPAETPAHRPQAGTDAQPSQTQPIRVTIGRVDIRASAQPPSPAPRLPKAGGGFVDLRLSRAHLDRNYG